MDRGKANYQNEMLNNVSVFGDQKSRCSLSLPVSTVKSAGIANES